MSGYGSNTVRTRRTLNELAELDDAIVASVLVEHPVSLRGVYYRVVSVGVIDKTEAGYRAVGRRLLALRRNGRIPYAYITDGTRLMRKPTSFNDIEDCLWETARTYRRRLWADQGVQVIVLSEKDAISGVVYPITAAWDVELGIVRGYASETFAYSVAESVSASAVPTVIYQLGDHDPSGVDAWRSFVSRVQQFAPDAEVTFERLAVTPEQIETYSLPTRPTKQSDTRAAGFEGGSVEVDALPASVLREVVEAAIKRHVDPVAMNVTDVAEASEREMLYAIAGGAA